jgi:tetratricopeptide (TPR) repeat protein
MKKVSPGWLLALLLTLCFTLATVFVPRVGWWNAVPRVADWNNVQSQSDNVFKLLFGEGRRLFANEMFVMADVYFHSGYYPSMFDRQDTDRDVADPAHGQADDSNSTSDDFLGPPPDWLAALERQFVPNRHTHLSSGGPSGHVKEVEVQEILPWLKLATDMNPQYIDSYTVGAYWLCRLHKSDQALDFLFEGIRNNPGNSELLFDLGTLYDKDLHDSNRGYYTWLAALRCWQAKNDNDKTSVDGKRLYGAITMALAHHAQEAGDWPQAIQYLEMVKTVSPCPDAVQKQIDEARKNQTAKSSPLARTTH